MIPPGFASGDGLLALIDLSGWTHQAWAIGGAEGMTRLVVARLTRLLEHPAPACVAVALDSSGPTWRHVRTEAMPPRDRYKASRERKPVEFYTQSRRIMEIVTYHRIPVLAAEGFEADDVIAAAVLEADALGLDVAIVSADKDLCQLVTCPFGSATPQRVVVWDGAEGVVGPDEVRAKWGVEPTLLGDLLAICGDNSDNVRGVPGIAEKGAATLLRAFGSLANVLATDPPTEAQFADFVSAINIAEKNVAKVKRKVTVGDLDYAIATRAGARELLRLAKLVAKMHEHRETVELARELVTLDATAPVTWDVNDLPVGDFDVERLVKVYREAGLMRHVAAVRWVPKARLEDVVRREEAA